MRAFEAKLAEGMFVARVEIGVDARMCLAEFEGEPVTEWFDLTVDEARTVMEKLWPIFERLGYRLPPEEVDR
jgi:hypothetical protein